MDVSLPYLDLIFSKLINLFKYNIFTNLKSLGIKRVPFNDDESASAASQSSESSLNADVVRSGSGTSISNQSSLSSHSSHSNESSPFNKAHETQAKLPSDPIELPDIFFETPPLMHNSLYLTNG